MTQNERIAFRQSQRWKNFREVMKVLHNSTCELCGSVKRTGREQAKLNVHHLYPDDYDNIDDHNDFVLLCYTCHEWVEFWVTKIKAKKFAPPLRFDKIVACIGEYLSEPAREKAYTILGLNKDKEENMKGFGNNNQEVKAWEEPSEKVHPARLIGIYDIGTQKKYQSDEWEDKRTIILRFELLGSEKTNEGKNFIKDKQFKWSNHTKSGLMAAFFALGLKKPVVKNENDFGGWYDLPRDFNPKTLLNKPCLVQIEKKQTGNGSKIGSITPIVEGMNIPFVTNEPFILDWDEAEFKNKLEDVPPYISNLVHKSLEMNGGASHEVDQGGFEDDIPPF